jgi:hypothetical protein
MGYLDCHHPQKMPGQPMGLHKHNITVSVSGVDQALVEEAFKPWLIARIYPTFAQVRNPDIIIKNDDKINISTWPLKPESPVIIKIKDLELLTHLIGHALGIPHVDHEGCLMSSTPGSKFTTVDLNEVVARYGYR